MIAKKLLLTTTYFVLFFSLFVNFASDVRAMAGDFSLSRYGSTNVTQGRTAFQQFVVTVSDGFSLSYDGDTWHFSVTNLPPNSTITSSAINGEFWGLYPDGAGFEVVTSPQTPVGTYNITVTLTKHNLARTISFPLVVSAMPAPLARAGHPSSNPPLPGLANWELQMVQMGRFHCDAQKIADAGVWEGGVWYYDGQRVFYQIADYTGDRSFEQCARYIDPTYRQYVLDNNGGIPAWRIFTRGFLEEYRRTGDPLAKQALVANGTNSFYKCCGVATVYLMREEAYALNGWTDAAEVTSINVYARDRTVDSLLSMFDQQFVAQTEPYVKPFMVGLAMEALIGYYEKTGDPRIPPAIKNAADWMWDHTWVADAQGFKYTSIPSEEGPGDPAPGLNNLIAPAYAWLYMLTGDSIYRDRGDQAFAASYGGSWLPIGKQFSQNYRWSFDYVKYRQMAARTAFDFDGDGRADISVFRPSSGVWYLNNSQSGYSAKQFGMNGDLIAPGDFDGDNRTDLTVFRPSNGCWYQINSSNNTFVATQFGLAGDLPRPGDFDGDGRADLAVFRQSSPQSTAGVWYRLNSSDGRFVATQFGMTGDKPLVGDFDGDAKSDLAVFRPSNGVWYVQGSQSGFSAVQFGLSGDVPVAADYDGDRKTDLAVFRPSNGVWYRINSSNNQFSAAQFGMAGDAPTPADYDGDGQADISVFRSSSGVWYRLNSSTGSFFSQQFGLPGDVPPPAAFGQ